MSLSPGYYTVVATTIGSDLVASLYPVGEPMWVAAVTVLCSVPTPAYAVIGTPIATLYAMDATRSGGADSSEYEPPRECTIGQPFSIIWPGVGGGSNTASMTVHVVAPPGRR